MTENTPTPDELIAAHRFESGNCSCGLPWHECPTVPYANALEAATAERDALAAAIEEARAAYGRGIELGDEGIDHYLDPEATLDSMWQSIDTAPATVLAQRDARVLDRIIRHLKSTVRLGLGLTDEQKQDRRNIIEWLEADRAEREAQR